MRINEIFPSIDGEVNGYHGQGEPTVFVRFQGCSAGCAWCDTEYAQDFKGGRKLAVKQVVEEVDGHGIGKVTITGGEPFEQRIALQELLWELGYDYRVTIETNGLHELFSSSDASFDCDLRYSIDYKLPSSGLSIPDSLLETNLMRLVPGKDWIKFVVGTVQDFNAASKVISDFRLTQFNIAMSPVYGKLEPKLLFQWMKSTENYFHVNCQLHKYVGMR